MKAQNCGCGAPRLKPYIMCEAHLPERAKNKLGIKESTVQEPEAWKYLPAPNIQIEKVPGKSDIWRTWCPYCHTFHYHNPLHGLGHIKVNCSDRPSARNGYNLVDNKGIYTNKQRRLYSGRGIKVWDTTNNTSYVIPSKTESSL